MKNSTLADIVWTEHSTLTTSRADHSSAVLQDTLYLLGHYDSPAHKTTEELNIRTEQGWAKSFDLQSAMHGACTVKLSNEELLTIAGLGEPGRKMFKYNVRTGDAVEYNNAPPTQVKELWTSYCIFCISVGQ